MTMRQFFLISPLAAVLTSMAAILTMALANFFSHLPLMNAFWITLVAVCLEVSRVASELNSTLCLSTFS